MLPSAREPERRLTRRDFLGAASLGALALATGCGDATAPDSRSPNARLSQRRRTPTQAATLGISQLELGDAFTGRNGYMYVPATYKPSLEAPLIVALHGAGGGGYSWLTPIWMSLLDELNAVMVAPDSRHFATWDFPDTGDYGEDVPFIDKALRETFRKVAIDPSRIALVGFSDGASEAIGLGLMNGDLFNGVVSFSGGRIKAPFARGRTRAFVAHAPNDTIISYSRSTDVIVPTIQQLGVPVEFRSHMLGHNIPVDIAREALAYALAMR